MKTRYSISITLEVERGYPDGNGVIIDTITTESVYEADDARHALNDALRQTMDDYNITSDPLTVTRIDIMSSDERE